MSALGHVELLKQAARRYQESGRYPQACALFVQAAELTEFLDADEASALWNHAGVCAFRLGDGDRAVTAFRKAIALTTLQHPDRGRWLARLYANLTAACYHGSRVREAWEAGRQALLLAEDIGDPRQAGNALLNLGLAERYLGMFSDALRHFARARDRYAEAGALTHVADALHNLGWVYLDRQAFAEGEEALVEARAHKRRLGEPTARIDLELGRLEALRGNWRGGRSTALAIMESPEGITDPTTHAQALLLAAETTQHESLPTALHYADVGVDLALSLGKHPILLDFMPLVIRLHHTAGLALSEREQDLARELYQRRNGVDAFAISGGAHSD